MEDNVVRSTKRKENQRRTATWLMLPFPPSLALWSEYIFKSFLIYKLFLFVNIKNKFLKIKILF
jgi:hypothetical protein